MTVIDSCAQIYPSYGKFPDPVNICVRLCCKFQKDHNNTQQQEGTQVCVMNVMLLTHAQTCRIA